MTEKLKSYLTADTFIPLSLIITLMGGVFWLSVMWIEGKTNAQLQAMLDEAQEPAETPEETPLDYWTALKERFFEIKDLNSLNQG